MRKCYYENITYICNMEEKWLDIIGYEGLYKISDLGNVKSLDRIIINKNGISSNYKGKVLKPLLNKGYYQVRLYKNGVGITHRIHKLVMMSFKDFKPNGHTIIIDHINNDPLDNRLNNLQLISQRKNASKDRANGSSKQLGVCWDKQMCKWRCIISIGKNIFLGLYDCELKAGKIYQSALKNIDKYNGNNKEFRKLIKK